MIISTNKFALGGDTIAGVPWSKRELEALEEMCKRGMTAQQISQSGVFKRSKHSIENQAQAQGFKIGLSSQPSGFDEAKYKEFLNGSSRDKNS